MYVNHKPFLFLYIILIITYVCAYVRSYYSLNIVPLTTSVALALEISTLDQHVLAITLALFCTQL